MPFHSIPFRSIPFHTMRCINMKLHWSVSIPVHCIALRTYEYPVYKQLHGWPWDLDSRRSANSGKTRHCCNFVLNIGKNNNNNNAGLDEWLTPVTTNDEQFKKLFASRVWSVWNFIDHLKDQEMLVFQHIPTASYVQICKPFVTNSSHNDCPKICCCYMVKYWSINNSINRWTCLSLVA